MRRVAAAVEFHCVFNKIGSGQVLCQKYFNRRYTLMLKKIVSAAIFIGFALSIACSSAYAADKASDDNTFILGFDFDNSAGIGSSQVFEFVDNTLRAMSSEYGITIQLKKFKDDGESINAMMNNEIDAAAIGVGSTIGAMNQNAKVRPWVTFTIGGNRKSAFCIWNRKEDGILKPGDLYGKKAPADAASTVLRWYLFQHGIDKPAYDVFDSFTAIPSISSAFMALAMGDIDVMWASADAESYMTFMNAGLMKKLNKSFCTDYVFARGGIVMNMERVSEEKFKRATELIRDFDKNFSNIVKKHPELKTADAYRKIIKIRMIVADRHEYDYDKKFRQELTKGSWAEEEQFVWDTLAASKSKKDVKVKPTYQMCKDKCSKDSAKGKELECIDKCLNW